jgi:hypothetical protein
VRISEIMSHRPGHLRRVGVRFEEQGRAMQAATRVYREANLDVEVEADAIWIEAPEKMALPMMQILERATGTRGFNDWEARR